MALMRTESRLEVIERELQHQLDDASVGDLVSRLAHEGRELAAIEVRRLRVEMKEQARRAVKAAAAGYIAVDFIALATLALAAGVFLVLGTWWDSYAAAAFATSGILTVVALIAGMIARKMLRPPDGEGHEAATAAAGTNGNGRVHRGS